MTYVNVFGGDLIQPANVSYQEVTFNEADETITLTWPETYTQGTTVAPAILKATVNETGCTLQLPDQTQASPGMMIIVQNAGDKDLTVTPYIGTQVAVVPAGEIFFFWLYDNTDADDNSHWGNVQYGSGTSTAQASDLAGSGLVAQGATLNRNRLTYIKTSAYIVTPADRDKFLVWQGGTGNITLPSANTVGNGFQISINNNSNNDGSPTSGTVNLLTVNGQTIDGYGQFEIFPGESLTVISNGVNWFSLGYSQQLAYAVGVLNLDVTGLGMSINLTTSQAQRTIQNYSGTLAGNTTIFFPTTPFSWYVSNTTTGAYTLQVQLTGGVGSAFEIPAGERLIFYSDGTSLHSIPTDLASAFPLYAPSGTVSAPPYSFVDSTQTGMYLSQPTETADELNLSVTGVDLASFINDEGTTDIVFTTSNTIQLDTGHVQVSGALFTPTLYVAGQSQLSSVGANTISGVGNGLTLSSGNSTRVGITEGFAARGSCVFGSDIYSTGSYFSTNYAGSVATPSIGYTATEQSSPKTGFYFPNSNTIGFSSNGTPTFTITSAGLVPATSAIRQTTFNNLSPTTTAGDMISRDLTGNDVRVPASITPNEVLLSRVGNIPVWGGYSVLQVQTFNLTTGQTYAADPANSTDTQLTLSITPTNASSKILVLGTYNADVSAGAVGLGLKRNGVFIIGANPWGQISMGFPAGIPLMYLDSPATTSPCTYTVVTGPSAIATTVYSNRNQTGSLIFTSTITLIEIGGF